MGAQEPPARTLLVTGASGAAGRVIRPLLHERGYALLATDLVEPDLLPGERFVQADLCDLDAMERLASSADAIIHLGGISTEQDWESLTQANLSGTRSVLEAARRHGVGPVLLASSTHAVGMHPIPTTTVAHLDPRPDSLYGVSKLGIEALGTLYGERFGLAVTIARIGTLEPTPSSPRSLSTWLSHADLARLADAAARRTDSGARIVWATSANTRRWFDLEPGRAMGYEPQDDAEVYAAAYPGLPHPRIGADWTDRPLGME